MISESNQATPSVFGPIARELLLISLLGLFCELMIIRWLATELRIFAYFKNLPLMAAFLGLGLGLIWSNHKRDYMRWSAISLFYLCGLLISALALHLTFLTFVDPFKFMMFGVGATSVSGTKAVPLATTLYSLLIILGTFVLATFSFVGFGQLQGKLFDKLKPLQAYSINVLGAILGTAIFSLLCWFNCSPGIWMALVGLGLVCWRRHPSHFAILALGIAYSLWLAPLVASNYRDGCQDFSENNRQAL